jgi:hypothetical protein
VVSEDEASLTAQEPAAQSRLRLDTMCDVCTGGCTKTSGGDRELSARMLQEDLELDR